MSGYEVVIEELEQRGRDAIEVGEATKRIELAEHADAIPELLPGAGETASEAATLSEHWERQLRDLGGRVATYGDEIVGAAERYEADEEAAAEELRLHIPQPGGPV
ncbi:hypothetical protein [Haloechinothrix sp. LS1_15]|uniref:hypothetical protein n=1 Tax=Haloechinothrix sp. LS1_15 TaxID=2652248 RepID=UPI00294435AD|nr:hypothetical protein [Haloechinothrix sp. LS1_15]MDV6013656.1 hypothetical protein [Haloechinothrix sp. LS1_15]